MMSPTAALSPPAPRGTPKKAMSSPARIRKGSFFFLPSVTMASGMRAEMTAAGSPSLSRTLRIRATSSGVGSFRNDS
jgi:hypothetical protein